MTIMLIKKKTQLGYIGEVEHTCMVFTNQIIILTEQSENISIINEDFVPPTDMNGNIPWANESNIRLCSILIEPFRYINLN